MPTHSEVFLTLRSVTVCLLSSNILLHLQDAPITEGTEKQFNCDYA